MNKNESESADMICRKKFPQKSLDERIRDSLLSKEWKEKKNNPQDLFERAQSKDEEAKRQGRYLSRTDARPVIPKEVRKEKKRPKKLYSKKRRLTKGKKEQVSKSKDSAIPPVHPRGAHPVLQIQKSASSPPSSHFHSQHRHSLHPFNPPAILPPVRRPDPPSSLSPPEMWRENR